MRETPLMITSGRGAELEDDRGRRYLDANSSIWTNLHGHQHAKLDAAVRSQLTRVAHVSALGLANEPAAELAAKLAGVCGRSLKRARLKAASAPPPGALSKVFFSDDGSTAMEAAIKMAYEFARRAGITREPRFLTLDGAYHGDTVGAVSLGAIDLFHKAYSGLLFKTDRAMSPHCYRCPFNKAKPERADARSYRKCQWECVREVEKSFDAQKQKGGGYAFLTIEPLMQGAAGMVAQPDGWLERIAGLARSHGTRLIFDEVMTGFGRTGTEPGFGRAGRWFAFEKSGIVPDLLCLAKGLTGGYMPMAATLASQEIFDVFLGGYEEFKTFFHGHSYTGNPLGAAVANANLEVLSAEHGHGHRASLEREFGQLLKGLWSLENVGDIRQVGLVAGIELVKNWRTREPIALKERAGFRVCEAMIRRGVITRPIGSVIVLMPPYCTTPDQLQQIITALAESIQEVFGGIRKNPKPNVGL